MSTPPVVLLGSAYLAPCAWGGLPAALEALGREVLVTPSRGTDVVRDPQEELGRYLVDVPADRPVALVAHSNAGLYVPAVAATREVVAAVHLDAVLPVAGPTPVAPAALLEVVGPLAVDGTLPPWGTWFDDADVAALVPDPAERSRALADQPRVAPAYLAGSVDVAAGWDVDLPTAHLAYGDTYAEEQQVARERGWLVDRLEGRHLHHVVDPAGVAERLAALLRGCCAPG